MKKKNVMGGSMVCLMDAISYLAENCEANGQLATGAQVVGSSDRKKQEQERQKWLSNDSLIIREQ